MCLAQRSSSPRNQQDQGRGEMACGERHERFCNGPCKIIDPAMNAAVDVRGGVSCLWLRSMLPATG
jgi:hypothetical protein